MAVSPAEVQQHLAGVQYPADKDTLVRTAESEGAPSEVLDILRELGDREYSGPPDVMSELGDVAI